MRYRRPTSFPSGLARRTDRIEEVMNEVVDHE
jgi:hypothetical protein